MSPELVQIGLDDIFSLVTSDENTTTIQLSS